MKRISWLITIIVNIILFSTVSFAEQMAKSVDEKVTIRWHNYNLAYAGAGREATEELISSFNANNPNITIEGVAVPVPEMGSRLQAEMLAGDPPDIIQVILSDISFIADSYALPSLDEILPEDEAKDHFSGMVQTGLELGKVQGKMVALPYVFSTPVLFYNADIFREAGLDPNRPPATWSEIKETAIQIKEKTGNVGFLAGIFGPGAFDWLYQGIIKSNGGQVISDDRKKMTFASPEGIEAMEILRDVASTGAFTNVPSTNAQENFAAGKVGMYLQTSAVQARMVKAAKGNWEIRASKMPSFGSKKPAPTNSGSGLMIVTKDPVKRRAAWEFIKHVTSDYGYTIIASKIGYVPLRMSAVESENYLAPWYRENPLAKVNLEQLKDLSQWVPLAGSNYVQIRQIMMNASEEAVFKQNINVADHLKAAEKRANALMPK